jgi:hypothetical protein
MASYAVIWPTGCLIQQVAFGDDEFDLARAARFGLFGAFYVAPTLNAWLTVARYLYPKNDLRSAIIKVSLYILHSRIVFIIKIEKLLGTYRTSNLFTLCYGELSFRNVFTGG